MTRFTEVAAISQVLSITAMEEASRFSQRTADLDHLFLALVLSEQTAGKLLRDMGITLKSARQAVADMHSSQLASLGIHAEFPQADRITFQESGGYEWSERASALLSAATSPEIDDVTAALLWALLAEPSGLVAHLLGRLGTTPHAVRAKLDAVAPGLSARVKAAEPGGDSLAGSHSFFIPAPVEEVWALLVAPARMREWGPCYGRVEYPEGATDVLPGETWIAHAATHWPDGKPMKVKPEARREEVELLDRRDRSRIAWRFTCPDAPDLNSRRMDIALDSAPGGTQLDVVLAWERNPDRKARPVSKALLRPVRRYAIWTQLTHIGGSISRVFR